ncbi:hypothetical protein EON68_01380, partial [archaeon]
MVVMEEVQAHALAAARQFGGMWLASMREVIKVALAQAYKTAPPSLLAHLPPLAAATRSVELVLLVLLLASSAYMLVACVRGTSARPRDAALPSTSAHRAPSPLPAATDKPRDAAAAAIAKLMRTRPSSVDGDVLFCTLCGQRVVEPCEDSVAKHVNGKRHKAAVDKYSTLATQAKPKLQPRHVLNWMSEDAFRSVYKARHGDEPSPTSPPAPAAAAVPAALPAATLRAATTVAGGAGAATSAKAADISVRHAPTEVQRSYFFELAHTNVLHDLASVRDAVTSKAEQQFMKALERDFMSFVDKRKHTYSPSVGSAAALLRFGCYYSVKDAQLQPKLAVHSMPPELKKLAQAVSRRVAEGLGKELPDLLACHAPTDGLRQLLQLRRHAVH